MARRAMLVITCDGYGCPRRLMAPYRVVPLTVLRRRAADAGWRQRGRRDYCPRHQPWPGLAAWTRRATPTT